MLYRLEAGTAAVMGVVLGEEGATLLLVAREVGLTLGLVDEGFDSSNLDERADTAVDDGPLLADDSVP